MESMRKIMTSWDLYVEETLPKLESRNMFLPIRPMNTSIAGQEEGAQTHLGSNGAWNRSWGSPLVCVHTDYHRALESALANLKKKEACLVFTSDFGANMAVMVAIGSIVPVICGDEGRRPTKEEKVTVFSDALNHAAIVDGLKLAEQQGVQVFVYKHRDITNCKNKRKVVVTDSLFSMDGDIVPMGELAQLRKKHGILSTFQAHGTFVWDKNGGGQAEEFNCKNDVDLCIGTLSKAASSLGGFVACSIYGTASVVVAKKESWRRREIRNRMKELHALTGIPVRSQIACIMFGNIKDAIKIN
ncbi:Detected protein of confused Function [Hibiscus syriacus]|uniref:Detected protein of confused Function n=1 Tax=Hibiscus syriacus TaxID=106335 RepID=A0A6A3BKK6_HIBSY|nr:Detected protein of confused Function [Hibiscus syriacus]